MVSRNHPRGSSPSCLDAAIFVILTTVLATLLMPSTIPSVSAEKPPGAIIDMGNVYLGSVLHNTVARDVILVNNAEYGLVNVDGTLQVVEFSEMDINNVSQYPHEPERVGYADVGGEVLFCQHSEARGLLFCLLKDDEYPIVALRTLVKQKGETFLQISRFEDASDAITNASFSSPGYRGVELTPDSTSFIIYSEHNGFTLFDVSDEENMVLSFQNTTAPVIGLASATGLPAEIVLQLAGPDEKHTIQRLNITVPTAPTITSEFVTSHLTMRTSRGCYGFGVVNTPSLKYPVVALMGCMNQTVLGTDSFVYPFSLTNDPIKSFYPATAAGRVKPSSSEVMYQFTKYKNNRFAQTLPDKKYIVTCVGSEVAVMDFFQPDKPRSVIEHKLEGTGPICTGVSTSGSILAVAYVTSYSALGVTKTFANVRFFRLQDFTSLQNSVWEVTGSQTLKVDAIHGLWSHNDGGSKQYVTTGATVHVQTTDFTDKTSPLMITSNVSGIELFSKTEAKAAAYAVDKANDFLFAAEVGLAASTRIQAWDISTGGDPTTSETHVLDTRKQLAGVAIVSTADGSKSYAFIFPAGESFVAYADVTIPAKLNVASVDTVSFPTKSTPARNWLSLPAPVNDADNNIAIALNEDGNYYLFGTTGFIASIMQYCVPTAVRFDCCGTRLYIACKKTLYIYSIEEKGGEYKVTMVTRSSLAMGSVITDLVESNDYTALYLATGKDGLAVVDISNVAVPVYLGQLRTSGAVARVETYGSDDLNTIYIAERSIVRTVTVRTDYFCLATVENNYYNAPATTTLATVAVGEALTGAIKVFDKAGWESGFSWVDGMTGIPTFLSVDQSDLSVTGTPSKTYEGETFIVKISFSIETETNGDYTTSAYKCWSYFNVVSSLRIFEYSDPVSLTKLRIASPSSIVSLKMTLTNITAGRFVTSASATASYGATVLSFDQAIGTLSVLGSLTDVNKMLGLLRFSVDNDTLGDTNITVVVDDTINNVVKWVTTLAVFTNNVGPSLNTSRPLQNFTFDQGKSFSIFLDTAAFIDPDDALTFTVQLSNGMPLPGWIVFYSDRQEFRGTSNVETTLSVEITANDGYKRVSSNFTITIENPSPTLHVGNVSWNSTSGIEVKLGQTRVFQFPEELFTDDDAISYTMLRAGGGSLPSWIQFDATTRQLTLSKPQTLSQLEVVFTASDGFKQTSLNLNVTAVNQPPAIVGAFNNIRIKLGSKFSHVVGATVFRDEDDASLTYDISGLPSFAAFDSSSRTIAGTASEKGNTTATVTASDGYSSAQASFDIEVFNAAPVLAKPLDNVVAKTGQSFSHGVAAGTFIDADDSPTFSIHQVRDVRGVPAVLPTTLYFDALSLRLSGKVDTDTWLNITLRATDGFEFVDGSFTLNVSNVPPVALGYIPSATHKLGVAMAIVVNKTTFVDTDDAKLTYTMFEVSNSGILIPIPRWVLWDAVNLQLTGAPQTEETLNFELQATDGFATASTRFSLTFEDKAPVSVRRIPNTRLKVGRQLDFKIEDYFSDPDDAALTYKHTMDPQRTWLSFDIANKKFYGAPDLPSVETANAEALARDYSEAFNITVEATDGFKSVVSSFILTVFDNAPRVNGTTFNGTLGELQIKALVDVTWSIPSDVFYDPDSHDQLSITTSALPSFVTYDARVQTVVGKAPVSLLGPGQRGATFFIPFTASDGHKSVSTIWQLTVLPNSAPTVNGKFSGITWYVNEDNSFPIPTKMFEDPDGDVLALSARLVDDAAAETEKALDSWMQFDAARGVLTGKPPDDAIGVTTVVITATDPYGLSVKANLQIESERSVLENLKFAFEWFGIVTAIVGPLIGIYGLWTGIVNMWKGKSVMRGANPFDKTTGSYKLENPADVESVKAYRREEGYACMKAFSHHWYNLLTLSALKNSVDLPDWLVFDQLECELRLEPDQIHPAEVGLVILVTNGSGIVLSEIDVDPRPLASAQMSDLTAIKKPSSIDHPSTTTTAGRLVAPERSYEDVFLEATNISSPNPHANALEDPFLI